MKFNYRKTRLDNYQTHHIHSHADTLELGIGARSSTPVHS